MESFENLLGDIRAKLRVITIKLDGKRASFCDYEDLYQEAVLHLWNQYRNRALEDKTRSYILQSCYFYLKNYIRKTYRNIDCQTVSIQYMDVERNIKFEDLICPEERRQLFNCIEAGVLEDDVKALLDDRENKVMSLGLRGFTVREIGKELGISHVMVLKIKKRIASKCEVFKKEICGRQCYQI